ncbi:MAG: VPLPA-CTERM sorting domain-containing protein, partial [Mangrovicoccus sp.]
MSLIEASFAALSAWRENVDCDAQGSCFRGWYTRYYIYDSAGASLLVYLNRNGSRYFETPQAALASAQADGAQSFTLQNSGIVYIGMIDGGYSDNRGGISMVITPTGLPLPASLALSLAGVAALGALRRKAQ